MTRESTREKLLDAGLSVFHQRGFNGSGVQDITDAAGVPKGSFYNHFASKEALGVAVVERYRASIQPLIDVLADTAMPPLQRLRRHFEQGGQAFAEQQFTRGCLLGNFGAELSDQSQPVREAVSSALADWTRAIAVCIGEAQKEGAVTSVGNPDALAAFVLNAWQGAMLRAKVDKRGEPLDQFRDWVFGHLLA